MPAAQTIAREDQKAAQASRAAARRSALRPGRARDSAVSTFGWLMGIRRRSLRCARMRSRIILASLLVVVVNAAGCGGSAHQDVNPEAMLDAAAAHPISSAQTEIDLRLRVRGVPQLSGPLRLRLEGPYVERRRDVGSRASTGGSSASALGFPVGGRVVSTGTNAYLSIYGDNYEVGTGAGGAANERTSGSRDGQAARSPPALVVRAAPGCDGDGHEGGVDCERISAPLRGGAMARDLGFPGAQPRDCRRPARFRERRAPASATTTASFTSSRWGRCWGSPPSDRARLGGATSIALDLDIVISDVGEPQHISAPAGGGYRPIRDLALTLNDLGVPIPFRLSAWSRAGEARRSAEPRPRRGHGPAPASHRRRATRSCSVAPVRAEPMAR